MQEKLEKHFFIFSLLTFFISEASITRVGVCVNTSHGEEFIRKLWFAHLLGIDF